MALQSLNAGHLFLLTLMIVKIGDVDGCNNPGLPPPPPPNSPDNPNVPCGTTCGQNRMNQNRDGQKIVGGVDAAEGEIGWQVLMRPFRCGGTLINDEWVLSAAHCFRFASACLREQGCSIEALLGILDKSQIEAKNVYPIDKDSLTLHPSYNPATVEYDFAAFKLQRKVNYIDLPDVYPACWPTREPRQGTTATVSGFGNTAFLGSSSGTLQKIDVEIIPRTTCINTYRNPPDFELFNNGTLFNLPPMDITDAMLCSSVSESGKSFCQGDSGGPLVTLRNGVYEVSGVVSFGWGCGNATFPSVYANTNAVFDWITSTTGSAECPRG